MGKDLVSIHVWRQTYTQNNIDNFYEEDFNILNPRKNERGAGDGIFRMEFPLLQWSVAGLYKIFGRSILLTRLVMWLIGLLAVLGMYLLVKQLIRDERAALIAAWAFNFSPSFFYFTINPLPDLLALCFGIFGLAFFFMWKTQHRIMHLLGSGVFLSLAALCKLPFGIYFAAPAALFLTGLFRKPLDGRMLKGSVFILLFALLPIAWTGATLHEWSGNGVILGMFNHPVPMSKWMLYAWQNLVSVLPESLLNYASLPLFLAGIVYIFMNKAWRRPSFAALALCGAGLLAYFFYELNMIGSIHDYYLFPFLPLLFILVAYGASQWLSSGQRFFRLLVLFLVLLMPVTAWLRMHHRWDTDAPGFNPDLLTYKQDLQNAVPDDALVIGGNDESTCIFFYYIHKKGWSFDNDSLRGITMEELILQGADYLYSDSRVLEEDTSVKPWLDEMIMEKGSIRVYRLREKPFQE